MLVFRTYLMQLIDITRLPRRGYFSDHPVHTPEQSSSQYVNWECGL